MKTSRLTVKVNPCEVAHPRAAAPQPPSGNHRFLPKSGLLKRLSTLLAACALSGTLNAGSVKLAWNPNPETDIAGYRLTYGTQSGNLAQSVNTGNVTSFTVDGLAEDRTYYFALRAVNTAGMESDPCAEISHTVPIDPSLLSRQGWSIHGYSSQYAPQPATAAIDGNPDTYWRSGFNPSPPPPHHLDINLGSTHEIAGFRYLPRQGTSISGDIYNYEFYVSSDGINWGSPVASGTFAADKTEKLVTFTKVSARYVRLKALSGGNDAASVAEFNLIRGEHVVAPPAANRAPVAFAASVSTDEDVPLAITLSASDPDGDTLTWQIVRQPAMGVLSGTAPALTYAPAPNANGGDSFTFRVSDGALTSDTVTVAITVRAVNDAPVAHDESLEATAGSAVAVTLRGTDVDGDSLSYEMRSNPTLGTLSGTAPNLTYTPAADAGGTDSFTFRVSDGLLTSNTATVTIAIASVTPPPSSPSLIDRSGWRLHYVDSQETPVYRAELAFDGDPSTIWHTAWSNNSATPPPHEIQIDLGKVESIAGFRYLPRQDNHTNGNIADYEFYVSMDGSSWGGPVASGKFVNSKLEKEVPFPSTSGRYVRLRQLTEVNGTVNCSVAEINLISGEPVVAPPAENRAPTAIAASVSTDEDVPLAITLTASDPDGDTLTWQVVDGPAMGSLSGTAPNLTYTPAPDVNGSDSFTFRVSDGMLQSALATISITIRPVNDAPVASGQSVTIAEDHAVGILLQASDKDGDSLTYRIVEHPKKGRLTGSAPNLTYTPSLNYHGTDSFTFVANDGTVDSGIANVTITITPVNDPPVVMSRMVATPSDTPLALTLHATDVDGDPLTYRIVSQPMKGRLSGTAPNLTYTPNPRVSGSDSVSYQVNDGTVDSAIATIFISLTAPLKENRPPVFSENRIIRSTGTIAGDYTCTPLEGTAIDPDGDLVAYGKSAGPDWLTVAANGAIGGTPPSGSEGLNTFTIRARDPQGAFSEAALEIQIESTNLPLPWNMERIGGIGGDSTAHGEADSLTLSGAGSLSGKSDSGLLVWQTLTGDGEITARISSLENTGSSSRIGLMIRESPAADSRHAFIGVDGNGYVRWVRRTNTGGRTSISAVASFRSSDIWLRLARTGGTISAFTSTDGSVWSQVASNNINLGASSYIGLVTSSGGELPATAVFNNVSVTP